MFIRTLLLNLAVNKKAERFVRSNRLSSRMIGRFVAGETIAQPIAPVQALNSLGATASLDLLGESVTSVQDVEATVQTYLTLIGILRENRLNTTVSVKPTALGLDISDALCEQSLKQLLNAALPDLFVQIDMEGSPYTQRTLDIFYSLRAEYENVGAVIQAYLYRSEADIEEMIKVGGRVRLCKGAYRESADIAYPHKSDVDANYIRLMTRLLDNGIFPGIATHDVKMIEATKAHLSENSLSKERFEFQMLYGVRRDLQKQLLDEGYNLMVYTPFGTHWYPYFMRRLAERPANLIFVLKSLLHR
ncbi:proline dehydrogenase [Armatimonadota bacterium]|nr:proline dehydrogenase [Armatimonadota bacterium]